MNFASLMTDMLIGGGCNYASFQNLHQNTAGQLDKSSNTQYFLALQYLVLRPAVREGRRRLRQDPLRLQLQHHGPYDDDMFSVRVRLMYLF